MYVLLIQHVLTCVCIGKCSVEEETAIISKYKKKTLGIIYIDAVLFTKIAQQPYKYASLKASKLNSVSS